MTPSSARDVSAVAQRVDADELDVVMRAARVFSAVVASSIAQSGDAVTWPQLRVLVVVATHDDVTTTTVASALDVHASSASRLCDRLVRAGFLARTASLADRRIAYLSLTTSGSALVRTMMAHRRRAFAAILGRMSPGDRDALRRCLEVFADAAGEPPEAVVSVH